MSSASQTTLDAFAQPAPDFDAVDSQLLTPRARLKIKTRQTARSQFWDAHDRESYTCPGCESGGPFEVHHRDGDPFNNHPLNLIAICHRCHVAEHRRRSTVTRVQGWKDEYSDLFDGGES